MRGRADCRAKQCSHNPMHEHTFNAQSVCLDRPPRKFSVPTLAVVNLPASAPSLVLHLPLRVVAVCSPRLVIGPFLGVLRLAQRTPFSGIALCCGDVEVPILVAAAGAPGGTVGARWRRIIITMSTGACGCVEAFIRRETSAASRRADERQINRPPALS